MKDIIKRVRLDDIDFLDNIKGRVKLELFDNLTGRLVERREESNMFTKALHYFYKHGGITNPSVFGASSIRDNPLHYLLGGVLLLDSTIEENVELIRVPAGVGMTANGARGVVNTGTPSELGSWNELESGWNNDGSYSMVWDWNTAQGNGNIACVCLSSLFGGYEGIGNKSGTNKTNPYHMGQYNGPVSMNGFPNTVIGYKDNSILTANIIGVSEWTVNEYAFPKKMIDVRDSLANRLIRTKTVSIPSDIQNLTGRYGDINHIRLLSQQIGNVMRIAIMPATYDYYNYRAVWYFSNEYPILLISYNVDTDEVTVTKLSPSTTGLPAYQSGGNEQQTMGISGRWFIFHKWAIDLTNLTNVIELADMAGGYNLRPLTDNSFTANGKYIDLTAEAARLTNPTSGTYYDSGNIDKLLMQNGSYIWRDPRYIATINNRNSPIIKDASKNMKVTYTLEFGEEAFNE